ncbi:hypothetical protein Syun_026434 [Stephania yunnanensis]|uniref:Probable magnesium transporter n=1 Tax=Stephania yunnanensis TaxID=152371 RepID=A0AAP0HWH6_9MAGN
MWEAVWLTLAATAGNNIGKVLQKKGTAFFDQFRIIRAYAFNKAWIAGFLMDIFGALLMLRALSLAPVSIIQPISGCGLAILCVFSHFYLKEVMNGIDWVGIILAGTGTIGVGIGGEEQKASAISAFRLPWMVFIVFILFVDFDVCVGFKLTRITLLLSLNGEYYCRMASVVSKVGFVLIEQGFSKMFAPLCISISACCSATGFIYQTRGLKHGRAVIVSTCAAVASILTGVLAGMLALGEQLPTAHTARLWLFLGWLFIISGVIILVTSKRLLQLLPRPLQRLIRGGADRSNILRRHGSTRHRDPNPSTVIQATALHHLITSPAKEKP